MAGERKSQRLAASAEQTSKRTEEPSPVPIVPEERPPADLRLLLPKTPGTKRRVIIPTEKLAKEVTSTSVPVQITTAIETGGTSTQGESEKEPAIAESPQHSEPVSDQSSEEQEVKSGDTVVLEGEEIFTGDDAISTAVIPIISPAPIQEQPQSSTSKDAAVSGDKERESTPGSMQETDQYMIAVREVTKSINAEEESSKEESEESLPAQPGGSPIGGALASLLEEAESRLDEMIDPEDIVPLSE